MHANISIKIYDGDGVDQRALPSLFEELAHWKKARLSPHQLLHTSWEEETPLLIIPGGRDLPFHRALRGEGNRRIRQYVENGGSFLGICAGAYYGCSRIEFDPGMPLEVVGERELGFFPGIARGPAAGLGSFRYDSECGARALLISDSFSGQNLRSYCNGGCYFVEAERTPNVQVLSRYLELGENYPAAIIHSRVGKGAAVLSGVHVELGASHFALESEPARLLRSYEAHRIRFFRRILGVLLQNARSAKQGS